MPASELEEHRDKVQVLRSYELGGGACRVGSWISKEMLPGSYQYLRSLEGARYRVETQNSDGKCYPAGIGTPQDYEEADSESACHCQGEVPFLGQC